MNDPKHTPDPERIPDHERTSISSLIDRSLADSQIEDTAIKEIDRALGYPARIIFPAGSTIIQEGDVVDGIYLRLSGQVTLSRKIDGAERIFHARTAGRVLGLMSLADGQRAFFTCKATADTELIHVSYQELDDGLHSSSELAAHFATLLLRSLSRRNQRAIELQIDINRLNHRLGKERDQLSQTLTQLEKAQTRLVESEKMAILGQLVAGIGHEMNNPIAAINRSADFVVEDLRGLAAAHPEGEIFQELLEDALKATPLSSREQRQQIAVLSKELNQPALARRLVKMGISRRADLPETLRHLAPEDLLTRMDALERYYQLGASLRNIQTCSNRMAGLVSGLRGYARAGKETETHVDLLAGLDETLLIFGHALREITLEKSYGPTPLITCQPGEINQIWTNLISNALQAMDGSGTLRIDVQVDPEGYIVVQISDTGHGIPPENLEHIFDINFTTREGKADFGLGLGLAICKDIVHRHGGTIAAGSRPGRTEFIVRLPIRPPGGFPRLNEEEKPS